MPLSLPSESSARPLPTARQDTGNSAVVASRIAPALMPRTWSIGSIGGRSRCHAFLVGSGEAELSMGEGAELELTGPVLVWIPKSAVGEFRLMAGGDGATVSVAEEFVWRTVGDTALAPQFRRLLERTVVAAAERIGPRLDEIRLSFEALARESRGLQPGATTMMGAHLALVLLHLWRAADVTTRAAPRRGTAASTVQHFQQLVELHYRENLRIDDYAARLGVSRAHLHDACLRVSGRTPLSLVHDRLVEEARLRLAHTQLPVEQVAYGLGFRDPAYFNRFFKRLVGQSPGAFRQEAVAIRPEDEGGPPSSFAAWP